MTYDFTLIIDATFEGAYPGAEDAWMNAIGDVLFECYKGDATPGIRERKLYDALPGCMNTHPCSTTDPVVIPASEPGSPGLAKSGDPGSSPG